MEMYEVGGCVRDEILGVGSKDIDFTVVLSSGDIYQMNDIPTRLISGPFEYMVDRLKAQAFTIHVEHPEHLTARGRFPKDHPIYPRMDADFVLARKEGTYTDGRRPDSVEVGTLHDDLARRDFTMNAIAKDAGGNFIDPFNGRADIEAGIIRAVGDPVERLTEDALRAVRALRFFVTKGFDLDADLVDAMSSEAVLDAIVNNIADERIGDELSKMFRFDTVASVVALAEFPTLTRAMFSGSVSLDSTMKTRGRGR